MVKFLVCGDVEGQFETLLARVQALENSSHGPFQFLFITGSLFQSVEEYERITQTVQFPIPTYALDRTWIQDTSTLPQNFNLLGESKIGISSISNLTVAFMCGDDDKEGVQSAIDLSSRPSYRGCDLFLSNEWPKDMHHFLPETDMETFRSIGVGMGSGSQAVTNLCTAVRPRYHFAASKGVFFQRAPYRNDCNQEGLPSPCTRFISLGKVSTSKDKDKKWLHALSLEPIIHLSTSEVADEPSGVTDCPYVAVGKGSRKMVQGGGPTKRTRGDDASGPGPTPQGGSFFFGNMGGARDGRGSGGRYQPPPVNLVAPHPAAKTLFVGGLSREVRAGELLRVLPNSVDVRRPEGELKRVGVGDRISEQVRVCA